GRKGHCAGGRPYRARCLAPPVRGASGSPAAPWAELGTIRGNSANCVGAPMAFRDLFTSPKPLIACIHLIPLPGSPRYAGTMREVYDTALAEAAIFAQYPIDGLIVENFRDAPFYPHALPAESIAALTAVTREVVRVAQVPVGVNALRNHAQAAMAIATARQAEFTL